jgi:hypothetical protein
MSEDMENIWLWPVYGLVQQSPLACPLHSTDLTATDIFLWDYIND